MKVKISVIFILSLKKMRLQVLEKNYGDTFVISKISKMLLLIFCMLKNSMRKINIQNALIALEAV